ncbi:uncharacterized protein K02A2.6-like [Macrosteles quadrilineatus]|uniref:uncharacterized protein K02A2.6-like n=1 Tax=Macrosteles quadrilineatus TaxID=74068 RepID=UPI0023E0FAB7|nr:uncharacterized protein K02A2.6-like [Macrosteles quadrilineatus]
MKQQARRYVYWPNIDKDIEHLVKGCENCALTRSNPPKAPNHPWEIPKENWERIHIDYAGPFQGFNFLVCIDARSKWAEIKVIKDAPSSSNTINLLEQIFATHGYPNVMVSDNASIFQSDTFQAYCKLHGIFQKFISPGHPATNGLAERSVQTLKNRLKSTASENIPMAIKVQKILMRYRATPLACGKSPAELYLHRKLRIRMDAIFPNVQKASTRNAPSARSFNEGERVQVRLFINNKNVWEFGEVNKKLGTRHYLVSLDKSGRLVKRHIDQLRSTLIPKPKIVTTGPIHIFDVPRASKHSTKENSKAVTCSNPERLSIPERPSTPLRPSTPERPSTSVRPSTSEGPSISERPPTPKANNAEVPVVQGTETNNSHIPENQERSRRQRQMPGRYKDFVLS